MSETITREDGTEIEVFTQEELDTQKEEAINKYKEENPVDELKTKLAEKEEELKKELEKGKNFAELRKKKNKAEGDVDEKDELLEKFKEDTNKQIEDMKSEISKKERSEKINKLSTDEEEKKKIGYYLDKMTGDDFEENLKDAYFLATKQEAPGISVSNSGAGNSGQKKEEMSEGAKSMAKRLGMNFINESK